MKKSTLTLLLISIIFRLFTPNTQAQSINHVWANALSGNGGAIAINTLGIDGSGNIYLSGSFSGTIDFNPGSAAFNLSTATFTPDIFLAKYNAQGQFVWAKSIGGPTGTDETLKMKVDRAGNCYFAGYYNGTVDFDAGSPVYNLSNAGSDDAFFAKYDSSGNFMWARGIGSSTNERILALDIDKQGRVYIGGFFSSGSCDFDPGSGTAYISHAGGNDFFLAKYDSLGGYVWAKGAGNYSFSERISDLVVDDSTNIYVCGIFSYWFGSPDFDFGPGTANLNGGYYSSGDIFICKYSNSSAFIWGRSTLSSASSNNQIPGAISLDSAGSVYISGAFTGTADFDPGVSVYNLSASSPSSNYDVFMLKLNQQGNFVFANRIGSASNDYVTYHAVNYYSGDITVTGSFSGTVDFDPNPSNTVNLTASTTDDLFLARYDLWGNYKWAFSIDNSLGNDRSLAVVCDSLGSAYPVGYFAGHSSIGVDFDPGSGTNNLFAVSGALSAGFYAKYANCVNAPAQPGTISGDTMVCAGISKPYSITAVNGATSYQWILPGGWTGSSSGTSINIVPGNSSDTIRVKARNACGQSAERKLYVQVLPAPAQPASITGDTFPCVGTTKVYRITPVSNASSYQWSIPSAWSGSSTTDSIVVGVGSSGDSITVRSVNACGVSAWRKLPLAINVVPSTPTGISGPGLVCAGSQQTYTTSTVSGASSYQWLLPAGWSGSSNTNAITLNTGSNSDTLAVRSVNACGNSNWRKIPVAVKSVIASPAAISGNSNVCAGSAQTYNINAVTGAVSYTWVLPSGWSGSSGGTSITINIGSNSDTLMVRANDTCGSSVAQKLFIQVNNVPASPAAISGAQLVCPGATQLYKINKVPAASSYQWLLPAGWSGSSTDSSISVGVGNNSDTLAVRASNSCGNSAYQKLSINVKSTVAKPAAISGNGNVCAGSTQTYSITPVSGASSYTWNLPAGWTGNSNGTSITVSTGNNSDTIRVVANDSCGSSPAQKLYVHINNIPATPLGISGPVQVCSGSYQLLKINTVPGAASYNWQVPAGWNGSSNDSSISLQIGNSSDTIYVQAVNTCGSSAFSKKFIQVLSIPAQPASITGASTPCAGSSQVYNISSVNGASSYTWTLPNGWSGSSNSNAITAITGTQSGTLSVTAGNSCGNSAAQSISVSPLSAPPQPGSITGNNLVCPGSLESYSISPVSGASTYTWSAPAGWNGSSTSTSLNIICGNNSGTLTVVAGNACGNSPQQTLGITVNQQPQQPGSITGSSVICEGSQQVYSIASVPGATSYLWTLPGSGWSGSSTGSSISVTAGTASGSIAVSSVNTCGNSTAQSMSVAVNKKPSVLLNLSDTLFCSTIQQVSLAGGFPGGGTYSGPAVSGSLFSPAAAGIGLHSISYQYTDANSCSNTATDVLRVQLCTGDDAGISSAESWKLYPNPAHDIAYLQHKAFGQTWTVQVFNVLGAEQQAFVSDLDNLELDLRNWKAGVYVIRASHGQEQRSWKLLVQH